ncbi:TEA family protein [Blumeria hordei DH14]|uniref:TEA family protein n=1 Tax=Blumeria graminis f. sp. hordei (strain DH14) TaxID=546991 RepID=N1JQ75_BLUG1|nr:TEA family protein [Blumeria hordei DH14]
MEFLPKKSIQCQTGNEEFTKDFEAYRALDQNSHDRRSATTDLPNVYVCRRTPDWYSASHTTVNNVARQTPLQRTMLNKSNSEWKNIRDNTTQCQNPILDSPQYQAYRARQEDSDACDEKKWPPDLEGFFLDGIVIFISFASITDLLAMMDIPPMGRQKYTFNGKPHGRNELIALYIWIAYRESLPSGVAPSPLMIRHRKQISSHIQVLKKYLQGHSAFSLIFPPIEMIPESGYPLDSNPCLVALSQGRLPDKRYRDYIRARYRSQFGQQIDNDSLDVTIIPLPIRPAMVSLTISIPLPRVLWGEIQTNGDNHSEQIKGHATLVQFKSALSVQSKDDTLESIPRWREKFPRLLLLPVPDKIDYAIIHIHVSLDLSPKIGQNEIEFSNQIILSIPNSQPDNCECRVLTTLTQSFEIPDDPRVDGSVEVGVLQAMHHQNCPKSSDLSLYPWQHHLPITMGLEAGILSRSEISAPSVVVEQVPSMNGHNFYQNNRQLSQLYRSLQGSEDCSIEEFDMARPIQHPNSNSHKYQDNHTVNWNLSSFHSNENVGEAASSNGEVTSAATLDWIYSDLRAETSSLTWDYVTES